MAEAAESWNKFHTKIANTPVTENFLSILNARTKKEQIKLLKNLSLTPDQLLAFIFTAYSEFGYLFSEYVGERNHKGFDPNAVPAVFGLENGSVHKIGPTSLTDGQLKQVIEQRKVIVSKFLDKGEQWHCLFLTYDSLKGKESWKDGQPHFHYISDKFGIARNLVAEQLKRGSYNFGSLPHIDLTEYREKV